MSSVFVYNRYSGQMKAIAPLLYHVALSDARSNRDSECMHVCMVGAGVI